MTGMIGELSLPIDNIHPDPAQPRIESGDITELVGSIAQRGVLQAPLVRKDPHREGHYIIIAGERRWTAARLAGETTLPCRVKVLEGHPADIERLSLIDGLAENLSRLDLSVIERARAYGRLRDIYGMTAREIGQAIGLHESTISGDLALLELDEKTQERVHKKEIRVATARAAVKKTRNRDRKKSGQGQPGARWEPDHFTKFHHLSRRAETMCDERGHTSRRRLGRTLGFQGACGQCWETVIRQDQDKVTRVEIRQVGLEVPFLTPTFVADNPRESTSNGTTQ